MQEIGKILVIDDDSEIRYSLKRVLEAKGYTVILAGSGEEGIEVASAEQPAVIFSDNRMTGISGLETLQHIRNTAPKAMVIIMTAYGTTQSAIEAMKFGAFDYIVKPFELKKIFALTEKALLAYKQLNSSMELDLPGIDSKDYEEGMVGSTDIMRDVFKLIGQVAPSNATVMITGESGTGKELVARCINRHSLRSEGPFIAVNCAAIPENLIESELFGHEKGSFTGATNQKKGRFELADQGTIFLDELGDMTLSTQTKVLRVLQEGEIQRVGGVETIKLDVRLLAATNKNLEEMVKKKEFREDLYYRLNVFRLRLPSLRERIEDIPLIVNFLLQKLALKNGKSSVERMKAQYHRRRDYLVQRFNQIGLPCHSPGGSFYVFPDIQPTGQTSKAFATEVLEAQNVAVVPGTAFGPDGEGFVRASFSTSYENLIEAGDRIERYLNR